MFEEEFRSPWHSVIDCYCKISELAIDVCMTSNKPSYLTELVLKRERESNSSNIDLETILSSEE